jgi:hypothetical protein
MKSRINSNLDFGPEQRVVSLVRHNQHAIILLETYDASNQYEVKKIDFNRNGRSCCIIYGADIGQLFWGKTYNGIVNNVKFSHPNKPVRDCTGQDIFMKLKLADKGYSWLCNWDEAEKLNNENGTQLPFNIKGKRGSRGVAHNCCTWAVERLEMMPSIRSSYPLPSEFLSIAHTLVLPNCQPSDLWNQTVVSY